MRNGSFGSADQALRALQNAQKAGDPYQFAILDYQMPVMNGAELVKMIRADAALRQTVLVMLTSVGHWREWRPREGVEIDACLVKPVRQAQLLNALTEAWSKKLPAVHIDKVKAEPSPSNAIFSLAGKLADSPVRALLVEDNVVNQKVAVRMLERLAGDGREAVRMFTLLPYDVVFMDCQMPEMDGYTATREIRRGERPDEHVVIVAMTAEAMTGCRERCLAAGMDDYITKPVRLEDLMQTLEKWVLVRIT